MEAMRVLIAAGANILVVLRVRCQRVGFGTRRSDDRFVDIALIRSQNFILQDRCTLLHRASEKGHTAIAALLLADPRVDINARDLVRNGVQ